jgi:BirA family biotin operon repressor/biotin-[acetyl-CoA-carboxylase] ligase
MFHQVLKLLADGQAHSIAQLCQHLSLTSTQLLLILNTLVEYGVPIHIPTFDTYQLRETLELLETATILMALTPSIRQRLAHCQILEVVDSTNQYALMQTALPTPGVFLSEYQTAGRGQYGRQWLSPYASGLCLSLKQHYATLNHSLIGLNLALAIAVVRTLRTLGADEVGLKWPNDVYWRGRKLAGLLMESRREKGYDVVIGIGMNINVPTVEGFSINQPWVDLTTVLGWTPSRNQLAANLIENGLATLEIYPQVGLAAFLSEWQTYDVMYGQTVTLKLPKLSQSQQREVVTGTACGIDAEGALLLRVNSGYQRYLSGEVSISRCNY